MQVQALSPPASARGVLQLAAAQVLAVLVAAGAAVFYGRWLTPADLAGWLLALAVARALAMLLDGGLKTALVRREVLPAAASLRKLQRQAAMLALLLAMLACALATLLAAGGHIGASAAWLLALCPLAYLGAQLPLPLPLARLERAGRFGVIGRAEGSALLVEFALPVLLLAAGLAPAAAFGLAVVLGRSLRCGWIMAAAHRLPPLPAQRAQRPGATLPLWRDAASVQAVAAVSMLRDQMHFWLLGPWFGATWAGLYALAHTACALVGQAPLQVAARVVLPSLRQQPGAARWPLVLRQTRLLSSICLPPLLLLPGWLAWADARLWGGQWTQALDLMPWLLLRMVAGVALSPLGAALLLLPDAWVAARVHVRWTVLEVLLAVSALWALGPLGLAAAGALGAWLGLLLFAHALTPPSAAALSGSAGCRRLPALQPLLPALRQLLSALLLRPSLALASILVAWSQQQPQALLAATLALPLCWLAEPALRRHLRRGGAGAMGAPAP